MSEATLACPKCLKSGALWEEAAGWRAVERAAVREDGRRRTRSFERVEDAEPTGEVGCSACQWKGLLSGLVQVDRDGKPLPVPIPGQEALA